MEELVEAGGGKGGREGREGGREGNVKNGYMARPDTAANY